jgi:hypothetical protein
MTVISRAASLVLAASSALALFACIAPPAGEPQAVGDAPPIVGTLYVEHASADPGAPEVEVRRGDARPLTVHHAIPLLAREKPSVRLSDALLFGGTCAPVAISPDGHYGACLRSDGFGTVMIFRVDHPKAAPLKTVWHIAVVSGHMAGFLADDTLAVAADDQTCPQYVRYDGHYSAEPRARLYILTAAGKQVKAGPCIHGLVVGAHKIAFIGHDGREHPAYSFDGSSWQPGLAATFDGADHLLIINQRDQLVDDQNRLVAADVVDAAWTR